MRALLLSLALAMAPALAQATWIVQTLIPEAVALRTPTTQIVFELKDYPPKTFPATYPASNLEGGVLPVQVFANTPGVWSLLLQIPDLKDPSGALLLPARCFTGSTGGFGSGPTAPPRSSTLRPAPPRAGWRSGWSSPWSSSGRSGQEATWSRRWSRP